VRSLTARSTSSRFASASAWRRAIWRTSRSDWRQPYTSTTSSNTTQPACSAHRQGLAVSTPYTDRGQKTPRRRWSAATTAEAVISTRQSR
jgi:hypothetical protein